MIYRVLCSQITLLILFNGYRQSYTLEKIYESHNDQGSNLFGGTTHVNCIADNNSSNWRGYYASPPIGSVRHALLTVLKF